MKKIFLRHFDYHDNHDNNNGHQVEREDHGEWMCLVNDNQQFDAVKQFVFLEVIIMAIISIKIMIKCTIIIIMVMVVMVVMLKAVFRLV